MDPRVTIGGLACAMAVQEGIHDAAANRSAAHLKTCQQESTRDGGRTHGWYEHFVRECEGDIRSGTVRAGFALP